MTPLQKVDAIEVISVYEQRVQILSVKMSKKFVENESSRRSELITKQKMEFQMNLSAIDFSNLSIDHENVNTRPQQMVAARMCKEFRPRKSVFRCRYCSREFTSLRMYLKHKKRVHENQVSALDVMFAVLMFRSTANINHEATQPFDI